MIYDLHVHTSASDGYFSPEEVLSKAWQTGLGGIAVTDHDTVDGLQPIMEFKAKKSIDILCIPGIEMNTELDEEEIHILGYFIDYQNSQLITKLKQLKASRYDRAVKMINKLRNMGFNISLERVQQLARGDLIGRPHIAQALVEKNLVFSIKEAFSKYLGKGRPAYVSRYKFIPQEAISLIKEAEGIAVLAHPGLINDSDKFRSVLDMGIEGIEVFYPEHNQMQIKQYTEICHKRKILITGGSDFHGIGSEENRNRLGCAGINQHFMQDILDYYHRKDRE